MPRKAIVLTSVVCLLLLAGGGYLFFFGDEDEKIINRNLDELVELAEKTQDESPFVTLGQSRKMLKFIAQDPVVELGPPLPKIDDREELQGILIQVRQSLQTLSVRIREKRLLVAEDRQSAQMEIEADGNVTYSGESGRERRRFSIGWIKDEGEWLIQTVRVEREGGDFE